MTPDQPHIPVVPGRPAAPFHLPQPPTSLPPIPAAPKRRGRLALLIAASALVVAGLVAGGLYLFLPGTIVVHGSLTLFADFESIDTVAGSCLGRGGYADVREGLQVTVTGPDGTILGFTRLGKGERLADNQCQFPFTVEVPAGEGIYTFATVDRRGDVKYSEEEVLAGGVRLKIGG